MRSLHILKICILALVAGMSLGEVCAQSMGICSGGYRDSLGDSRPGNCEIKEIYRLDGEIQSYSAGLSELEKYDNAVRDARNQFLAAAQARLKSAESLYWAAYWKADEWDTFRWDEGVQDKLRKAYSKVMSINDVDLKLVSDGAYNDYKNLKAHIEEHLLDKYKSPVEVTLSIENFMPKESGQ